ncbi:bifunctional methylenetetrahydrofolate dehydrogenase/methenyltetrahydrofolate cyclohydrolase FolD [Rhodocaloribacter sp.]
MAQLIDGKAIAAQVRGEIREAVSAWTAQGHRPPCLRVVLVGEDPASASYVRGKQKAALEVGIDAETLTYESDITEAELLRVIDRLNRDAGVDGILVQLPLPAHIDEQNVIYALNPDKDVDCFHPANVGRIMIGEPRFLPCTPAGIMEMLRRTGIETRGQRAVIVGRSNIVGKPMANLLMQKGVDATVTVCHSRTRDLPSITREADLLVAAIGRAHFITADMVRDGVAVIDVGINRVEDASRPRGYRLVGDVDFDAVREKASWITPVPGGVGPMTIAMLLRNTLKAAQRS